MRNRPARDLVSIVARDRIFRLGGRDDPVGQYIAAPTDGVFLSIVLVPPLVISSLYRGIYRGT